MKKSTTPSLFNRGDLSTSLSRLLALLSLLSKLLFPAAPARYQCQLHIQKLKIGSNGNEKSVWIG